jgi:hypothetical protein
MLMAPFMSASGDIPWHERDVAVTDSPFRNDVLREGLHLGSGTFQHGHLETAVMIEMNMKRRLGEAVVIVEVLGEPLGQLSRSMIVDVT